MSYFYEGLTPRERQFAEMMYNGDFLQKDLDEAIGYLDDLTEKAHTWTGPSATESTNRSRPASNPTSTCIYHLREEDSLRAKVEALIKELETPRAKARNLYRMYHVLNLVKIILCVVELTIQHKSVSLTLR